ncbi:YfhO family protein [Pedobacter ginsengisoli]|uniref:YfhO family protein n=1 Tax=Pedobacter ginsengisoli TaxID=363852 RepID=UPI00254FA5E6|nr:YfhO family protein [Pedobacter ginsengisoli]
MKKWFQSNYIHFVIIAIFLALCLIYFSPAMQGKVLYQSDVMEAQAMSKEIMDVKAQTGTAPLWTNSMFGGMPAFQIWARYPGNMTTYVIDFLKNVFPDPVDTILCFFLGSYFLLNVLKMKPWLAAAGAVAFTFSSYNFIYILAGHSNHAMAMAIFAPVLGSILLTMRGGKYLLPGSVLTAFFLALEIRTNHVQMTYYLFIIILIFMLIELYHAISTKQGKTFFKAVACLAGAVLLAVAINAGSLWSTWEYGQESIRGKSNLTQKGPNASSGLDRDYAYQYSQGVGEISTFLVPNMYGGASNDKFPPGESEVAKALVKNGMDQGQAQQIVDQLNQGGALRPYWGDKPSTAGSWYFGSIVIFLFILGLFIVNNRFKWWIASTSFLFIFLSFGRNFPLVSDLFFDYVPMYNKFRSVDFALAVPAFLFPLLAFLALKELIDQKDKRKELPKKLLHSFYITAGILLLILFVPGVLFDFKTASHQEFLAQLTQAFGGNSTVASAIGEGLVGDRIALARADALRSLIFVSIGFGTLWFMMKSKIKTEAAAIILGVAILIDMWAVDRRYLNNSNFYDKYQLKQNFQPTTADQQIMADPALNYRVIDLSRGSQSNPFFDASASYFHKSVGGRHSARLQRYDEMVSTQFNGKINEPILDMLNTKYIIATDSASPVPKAVRRPTALGNAWFVKDLKVVKNADEEMEAIGNFDPKTTAVVEKTNFMANAYISKTPFKTGKIELLSYHPDHMKYKYELDGDAKAIFSEIWYDKGWNAYVDGKKINYFRANYILRGVCLGRGSHILEFKFEPASYLVGDKISMVSSILLVLAGGLTLYRLRKKK